MSGDFRLHYVGTKNQVRKMLEEHVNNCRNTEPSETEHDRFIKELFTYLKWGKLPKEKKIKKDQKSS